MKRTIAYQIGHWLTKPNSLIKTIIGFVAIYAIALVWCFASSDGTLLRANMQAEKDFITAVETTLPKHQNRGYVFVALQRLREAYLATGERDDIKIAKFDRLQSLLTANVSDAAEWEVVAITRDHTRLVANRWFTNPNITFFMFFGVTLLGIVLHGGLFIILRKIDNRLYWLPSSS